MLLAVEKSEHSAHADHPCEQNQHAKRIQIVSEASISGVPLPQRRLQTLDAGGGSRNLGNHTVAHRS